MCLKSYMDLYVPVVAGLFGSARVNRTANCHHGTGPTWDLSCSRTRADATGTGALVPERPGRPGKLHRRCRKHI